MLGAHILSVPIHSFVIPGILYTQTAHQTNLDCWFTIKAAMIVSQFRVAGIKVAGIRVAGIIAACCVNMYMPDCTASAACSTVTLQALLVFSTLQLPVDQLPAVQLSATAQHFADLLC